MRAGKNRACLNCGIIQSIEQFKQNGCPNCPFLQTNRNRNYDHTTSTSFKGQIAYTSTAKSWVAKWMRNYNSIDGYYAMTVEGDLSDDFIMLIEKNGGEYINRNQTYDV